MTSTGEMPAKIENRLIIKIVIIFRSDNSLEDATEFNASFNKIMGCNSNCQIVPTSKGHSIFIDFRNFVVESEIRELIESLTVKKHIKNSELIVGGWVVT